MEIARKSKKKRLVLALLALAAAVVSTALMAITSLIPIYPLMWAMIPVAILGYYGMAFLFPAYGRMKVYIRITEAVELQGKLRYDELSEAVLIKEKYLKKYLTKCLGRRYITRYALGIDGLVEV